MSTQKHDEVTAFLLKNEYVVKCIVGKDGHTVKCKHQDVFCVDYSLKNIDNDSYNLEISYQTEKDNDLTAQESIVLPTYTARWYIFLDILRICRKHKLSHNIIRFFDEEGDCKELLELLDINISEEDSNIESTMAKPITAILSDIKNANKFDDQFIADGILYDFITLKGLMV